MRGSHIASGIAVALTLVVVIAVIALFEPMNPLNRGTSADFWQITTGVNLGSTFDGGVGLIDDDGAYFSPFTMDSSWLYRASRDDVLRDFPRVCAELDRRAVAGDTGVYTSGYQRWKTLPAAQQDAPTLLLCINGAWTARLAAPENLPGSVLTPALSLYSLGIQIEKSRHYWANFLFELVFLCGVIWFGCWPFIRRQSLTRQLIHAGLLPTLLMTPAWLGYCAVSGISIGPAGGIVYPYLMIACPRSPEFETDRAIIKALPKILDAMNQSPAWSISDAWSSKLHIPLPPGPCTCALYSLLCCAVVAIAYLLFLIQRHARLRKPGFEVLITSTNTTAESAPPAPAPPISAPPAPPE